MKLLHIFIVDIIMADYGGDHNGTRIQFNGGIHQFFYGAGCSQVVDFKTEFFLCRRV